MNEEKGLYEWNQRGTRARVLCVRLKNDADGTRKGREKRQGS